MTWKSRSLIVWVLVCLVLPARGKEAAATVPEGRGKITVDVDGTAVEVFTYRPAAYHDGPLLATFHGVKRNAEGYRDDAIPLADKLGMLVIAPYFDEKRFPTKDYQRGGVIKDGKAVPPDKTTFALAQRIIDQVREAAGHPDMPYYLLGHSGGGQFLVRWAAFGPAGMKGIIAANPGSHLFATTDMDYPYGLGTLPESMRDDNAMKRYLAAPLTLYLGTADIVRDDVLDVSAAADKQGPYRLARGHKSYDLAQALAKQHGWDFNWKLVEADGVGHNAKTMFANPQAVNAIQSHD